MGHRFDPRRGHLNTTGKSLVNQGFFFALSITDLPHHLSHILNLSFLFESNYILTNSVKPVTFALMPYNIFHVEKTNFIFSFYFQNDKTDFLNSTETSKLSLFLLTFSIKISIIVLLSDYTI